ncbi:flap endonuclease Fen1 in complex with substrate 5'-flap Dna, Sm3+, and K+ [Baffinella frigidus]|nr:flap endonuclease Fen1 in complex with substrate 5'-flap Dna, Sm3+, and K+ [Cryptophyta sp. CCMP2293]
MRECDVRCGWGVRGATLALLVLLCTIARPVSGGIKGLGPLLLKEAPGCCTERTLKSYEGKKLAIDASMAMYQFLIAVRAAGDDGVAHTLMNAAGEETSHLQGIFWRTIAMAKAGIKPLYVFDGAPPTLKSGEIAHRNSRRELGAKMHGEAEARGDVDEMNKQSKRTTRVTKKHAEDAKTLLRLMGYPTLDAPCEAEAQCAELCKKGVVHATATEDMDALCCGSPLVVRHLTFSEARKQPVQEYSLPKVLAGLNLTMAEFVDFCILCGTDFSDTIKGVGPKSALAGIRKHHTIEAYVAALNTSRHTIPANFQIDEVRRVLSRPDVVLAEKAGVSWGGVLDIEGVVNFLVTQKGFAEARVRGGLEGLVKARRQAP